MDCNRIDEFLDSNAGATLSADLALHLRDCDRCRRLVGTFQQSGGSMHVPEALTTRIAGLLTKDLEPVTPIPAARVFSSWLIGGFVALCVTVVGALGGHALAAMSVWQLLGSTALMGAGLVLLGLSIGRQIIPASPQPLSPPLLWLVVFGALVFGVALLFPWDHISNFTSAGLRCTTRGLLVALIAGVLAWWTIRRGVALRADLLGASIGFLAGLAGVTVLQFNCLILQAPHIIVWHIGIVIVTATAGFLVGRLWSAMRAGLDKR